jgi:DNA-binding NarL/FixJ family response regulator
MGTTPPVRVVIADDHPMFRFGLAAALATAAEIDVVGEAANGAELLDVVDRTAPDAVLTDLAMPGLGGVAASRALLDRHPGIAVLILTMHEDDESLFGALRAGARGYLLKGADRGQIVRAVLSVVAGDAVYGAAVARRIADGLTGTAAGPPVFPELTVRERDVLGRLATGAGSREIARTLGLSEKTVRNHLSSIFAKLHVSDRTAAVLKAREAGLIERLCG